MLPHGQVLPRQPTSCCSLLVCSTVAAAHASYTLPTVVCPKDTRWLIITNGDNEYAENFMQKVRCWQGSGSRWGCCAGSVGGWERVLCT